MKVGMCVWMNGMDGWMDGCKQVCDGIDLSHADSPAVIVGGTEVHIPINGFDAPT